MFRIIVGKYGEDSEPALPGHFARFFDYRALELQTGGIRSLEVELTRTDQYLKFVEKSLKGHEQITEREVAEDHRKALVRMRERLSRGTGSGDSDLVPTWNLTLGSLAWRRGPNDLNFFQLVDRIAELVRSHGIDPETLLMRTLVASREDLIKIRGTDYDPEGPRVPFPDKPELAGVTPDDALWAEPIMQSGQPAIPYAPKAFIKGMKVIVLYDRRQMEQFTREIWKFKNPSRKKDAVVAVIKPQKGPPW